MEHLQAAQVDADLEAGGARPWQRELAVPVIVRAAEAPAPRLLALDEAQVRIEGAGTVVAVDSPSSS